MRLREKQLTEGESWREEIQLNHEIQYDGNKGNKKTENYIRNNVILQGFL